MSIDGQITSMSSSKALAVIACAIVLLVIIISIVIPSPSSTSQEPGWMRVKAIKLGCQSRERAQSIESIRGSGDRAAFNRAATSAITLGECAYFDAGDEVYLMTGEVFGGMAQVRKRGASAAYWIYSSGL